MLLNTGSLIGTMLVTSGLGFAYWFVADRLFPLSAVGLASAATSTMMLLSSICLLGLSTLLISELPRNKGQEGTIISAALILVGLVGTVVGIIFALCTPIISKNLQPIGADLPSILLFGLGIGLTSVTIIADTCMIALLRGELQFWRNALFAASKLILLFVAARLLAEKTGISIYTTWMASNLISMLPLLAFGIYKAKKTHRSLRPHWGMMRKVGHAAVQHYILNLIYQTPTQILPVIATIMLSASANAWFYTASMIANFIFAVIGSLTTVLHATNATQIHTLPQKSRMTVGLSFGVSLIAGIVLIVGAHFMLGFFGHSYADQASWSLRILAIGALPLIIKYHYLAIHRIKDHVSKAIVPISIGSVLELVMAIVGTRLWGLSGLSLGWVIGMYIEAIIMAPTVFRTMKGLDIPAMSLLEHEDLALAGSGSSSQEESISISMKMMAIDSPTDMIRSIVFIDAPTIKLKKSELYGNEALTDAYDDATAPTIKLDKASLRKAKAAQTERELVKKNLPATKISSDQINEFMNAPTIKMHSIKKK
ncbi:lipopolysaccharide biosynthesis protein [Dictyobacter arantiisoli]|nr:oligosaccharide flippase family protein [Dictyobacter arantiisoli]